MDASNCFQQPRTIAKLALSAIAAVALSGCSIIFPPGGNCPDLDEVCPDVQCNEYATSNGCNICECEGETEPEPTVCFDSSECSAGQVCNTTDFCEAPPGCEDDQPCPDVCYGRCVTPPDECFSDGDCSDDEFCRFGDAPPSPEPTEPGNPNEEDQALIAPAGICVPLGCDENFDLPACPPGTIPDIDFSQDECGNPVCIPVDGCRDLEPEICEDTPGCRLESLPVPCECGPNEDCACPGIAELRCVNDDSCRNLGPEACDANPDCEGTFIGGGDCFEECNDNGECRVVCAEGAPEERPDDEEPSADPIAPPPPGDFVCTPRVTPENCRGDFDCGPNQRCEINVRCDDANCFETPSGEVICEEACEEFGICIDGGNDCGQRSEEECLQDPDCELVGVGGGPQPEPVPCECEPNDDNCACPDPAQPPTEELICVPRQPDACTDDFQCADDERCEVEVTCPPCADENDPTCGAPCFVEGVCVPLPRNCQDDSQCGDNERCDVIEICPPCACDPNDPNCGLDSCECFVDGTCVPNESFCFSDFDCNDDQLCNLDEPFCGGGNPGGLVACAGTCQDRDVPPGVCLSDVDCGQGFRCATEQDVCVCPDGSPDCFNSRRFCLLLAVCSRRERQRMLLQRRLSRRHRLRPRELLRRAARLPAVHRLRRPLRRPPGADRGLLPVRRPMR